MSSLLSPVTHWNTLLMVICLGCLVPVLHADVYENKWAVNINGGPSRADKLAVEHGFTNLGQIGSLENHYLFEHHAVSKRSVEPSHHHHSLIENAPGVVWAEQQVIKKRVKRDFQTPPSDNSDLKLRDPLWEKQWYLALGLPMRDLAGQCPVPFSQENHNRRRRRNP